MTSDQRPATNLIDTHAHLTLPEYDSDRAEVMDRAWEAGLQYVITIGAGDGLKGNASAVDLAQVSDRVYATVGIHPHDAKDVTEGWLQELTRLAQSGKVVAVGEIGLDYFREHSPPDVQRKIFRDQLEFAGEIGLPVVIHDRDAHEDVWEIISKVGIPKRGGVFHCFSGDVAFAGRVTDAGFYISVPGVVTFSGVQKMLTVVAETPLERIVLETDSPYLAPEPYRGKRNEPAYVGKIAEKIAEVKQLSPQDVARVTTLNAKRLFNLPGAELEPHIVYKIRNSLYLNITNRCNLACKFCPKFTDYEVKGYYLKLPSEPDVEQVFQAVGEPDKYDEVVFCGYGEPTVRLELLKVIARRMKNRGAKKVRLNTDGLANLVYGRDVLPELAGLIDSVSVSLNAPDSVIYVRNCPSGFGKKAFEAVCKFIKEAKKHIPEVVATVVALPGLDIEACRRKARELGIPLRVRPYMNVG